MHFQQRSNFSLVTLDFFIGGLSHLSQWKVSMEGLNGKTNHFKINLLTGILTCTACANINTNQAFCLVLRGLDIYL